MVLRLNLGRVEHLFEKKTILEGGGGEELVPRTSLSAKKKNANLSPLKKQEQKIRDLKTRTRRFRGECTSHVYDLLVSLGKGKKVIQIVGRTRRWVFNHNLVGTGKRKKFILGGNPPQSPIHKGSHSPVRDPRGEMPLHTSHESGNSHQGRTKEGDS